MPTSLCWQCVTMADLAEVPLVQQRYSVGGHAFDRGGYDSFHMLPALPSRVSSRKCFDDDWKEVDDAAAVVDEADDLAAAPADALPPPSNRRSSRVVFDDDWGTVDDPSAVLDVSEEPAAPPPAHAPVPRLRTSMRHSMDGPLDFCPDRRDEATTKHFGDGSSEGVGVDVVVVQLGAIGQAGVNAVSDVGSSVASVGAGAVSVGAGALSNVGSAMGSVLGALTWRGKAAQKPFEEVVAGGGSGWRDAARIS